MGAMAMDCTSFIAMIFVHVLSSSHLVAIKDDDMDTWFYKQVVKATLMTFMCYAIPTKKNKLT